MQIEDIRNFDFVIDEGNRYKNNILWRNYNV